MGRLVNANTFNFHLTALKKWILIALLALLLSGCADIIMTAGNKDAVTLKHDPALVDDIALSDRAALECARYGRIAVFMGTDRAGIGHGYATFRCVDPH